MIKILIFTFSFLLFPIGSKARTFCDSQKCDLKSLFQVKKAKYVIRYPHQFRDTLFVPKDCDVFFEGGSLHGPIIFANTRLRGDVNLKGSSISGTVKNRIFIASWLCAMDGMTDDAPRINEMLDVCENVFFPQGTYRLISKYNPVGKVAKQNESSIVSHIGITRNNVTLQGENGAVLITNQPYSTICIFSQPYQIKESVRRIRIKGITFKVENKGEEFVNYMHSIKLVGVNDIRIEKCVFDDFWCDAICLSHYGDIPQTGERTRNENVKIINNLIVGGEHHNNRNGVSVVSGKNVLIKGNTIRNTSRKDMPGAIDVEPNNSAYTIENIRIEKNLLEDIGGNCGAIEVCMFNGGPGHHISILGNIIRNCNKGLYIYLKTDNTTDHFTIKNNYVAEDTPPYEFVGKGKSKNWIVSGNIFDHPCIQDIPGDITVENLVVKNNKKKTD